MNRYKLGRNSLTKKACVAVFFFCLLGNLFHLISHFYTGLLSSDSSIELCFENGSAEHKQVASTQHQECLACQSQLHAAKPTEFILCLEENWQTDTPVESLPCAVKWLFASTALKRGPPSILTFC